MKLWGILAFQKNADIWFREEGLEHGPILAYETEAAAERAAAESYGYDDYEQVKADGWCEVRPLNDEGSATCQPTAKSAT